MDRSFSESHPDIKLVAKSQEGPLKNLVNPPKELTRAADISHIERHWQPDGLGSNFEPNEQFKTPVELLGLLEDAARELVPTTEYNRSTTITLMFPGPIGNSAVVEIEPSDNVAKETRDAGKPGEAVVNVVTRESKPDTNLITFVVQPAFPPKGSPEPVAFRVATAYPGEPAPRIITNARRERFGKKPLADPSFVADETFWNNHAFVVVK